MRLLRTVDMSTSSVMRPGGWANDLDHGVVGGLVEQLSAGVTLPPIKVDQAHGLVAGRHRLAAHDRLGLKKIRADVIEYDSLEEAEADGIAENLRRRILPLLERDKQLTRLVQLAVLIEKKKAQRADNPQPAENLPAAPKKTKPPAPKRQAIKAVASATGYSEDTVERAVKKQEVPPSNRDPAFVGSEAAEAEGKKRRARALKRMAVLLRKVEAYLPELTGLAPLHLDHIRDRLEEMKRNVWEASVDDARDVAEELREKAIAEASINGTPWEPPPRAPKKLKIQDEDNNPLVDERAVPDDADNDPDAERL